MAFWVLKAKRSRTDLASVVRAGRQATWGTKRPPKRWKPGDGVFLWQSSPVLEMLGFGTIVDIPDRDRHDESRFEVEYAADSA